MFSYETLNQHVRALSGDGRQISPAHHRRFGLSWVQQGQTAHRHRQTALRKRGETQVEGRESKVERWNGRNSGSRRSSLDSRQMNLFAKFKAGLQKTHSKLAHEIKRIVTRSPKLDAATIDELEAA